jgi:hypothetical protein
MKPVGLFDMDGTLFEYVETLRKDMRALMSPGEQEPEDLFDENKPYLKARMDLIKSVPGWWLRLPPLRLGWNVWHLAQRLGFENQILTKGPRSKPLAWAEKAECIHHWFGSDITINIVGKDKDAYYGRFLCDDYIPYIEGWLAHRPRGLGIMVAAKHNEGYSNPNVIRFHGHNLDEVERALTAVYKRGPKEHWRDYLEDR